MSKSPAKTPRKSTLFVVPSIAVRCVALRQGVSGDEIQLLPAGEFRATDGRPDDVDTWRLDGDIANLLIKRFADKNRRLVIDYEHQTLATTTNGQPAPAAGWISALRWREGKGLYASVTWTQRAQAYVDADEYLYISPVFTYDEKGQPLELLHAALTNDPALGGMDEVRLAAASRMVGQLIALSGAQSPAKSPKESVMNELLKALFVILGLSDDATEEEALAKLGEYAQKADGAAEQIAELTAEIDEKKTEVADLTGEVEEKKDEVAALKANTGNPDPTRFVPVAALKELQQQVSALNHASTSREVDEVVRVALSERKLTPALEAWARELGKKDLAALKAFVDQAAPIAALTSTQTSGRKLDANDAKLDDAELAVCRAMGLDSATYLKHRA